MKGRFWRKALAAALALLIVSGSTPIQPFSQVFDRTVIKASAATQSVEKTVMFKMDGGKSGETTRTDEHTLYTSIGGANNSLHWYIDDPDDNDIFVSNISFLQSYRYSFRGDILNYGGIVDFPDIKGKVTKVEISNFSFYYADMKMYVGKDNNETSSLLHLKDTSDYYFSSIGGSSGPSTYNTVEFVGDINVDENNHLKIMFTGGQKDPVTNPSGTFGFNANGTGYISVTYETEEEVTEDPGHTFSYSTNGDTLTATCNQTDNHHSCDLTDRKATLRLIADDVPYKFVSHHASLNIQDFVNTTGISGITATYSYENKNTHEIRDNGVYEIGEYTVTATVTIGGAEYTLTKDFNILAGHKVNNSYTQFSVNKVAALEGDEITISYTQKMDEILDGLTLTGATSGNSIPYTTNSNGTYTFTMPDEDVNLNATITYPIDESDITQNGDTFTIKTADGWDYFCQRMKVDGELNGFSGKTVELGDDITVNTMAGNTDYPFKGTFDGKGHTLTFNTTALMANTAPFHLTDGATIRNLHVTGLIEGGSYNYLGGLVGSANGNLTIENCWVSTQISTTFDSNTLSANVGIGGIVGYLGSQYNQCHITGCVFDGLIYNPNTWNQTFGCGGFVGCFSEYGYAILKDCLFLHGQYDNNGNKCELLWGNDNNKNSTFLHRTNNQGSGKLTNCFYVETRGLKQGSPAVTSATKPANLGAETDHCFMKSYGHVLFFDGKYYTPKYGDLIEQYGYSGEKSYILEYNDGTSLGIPEIKTPMQTSGVRYNRSFTAGKPEIIMLPFNITKNRITLAHDNANPSGKFYEFQGLQLNTQTGEWEPKLTKEVTEMKANTPYLYVSGESTEYWDMYVGSGISIFTEGNDGGNKTATDEYGLWTLTGAYEPKSFTSADFNIMVLNDVGELVAVTEPTKVSSTSGYFVRDNSAYSVNVSSAIGGTVTADPLYAKENDTVTLTVTPNAGYAVKRVWVDGDEITPVDGVYSFTMPASHVMVLAEFEAIGYTISKTADHGTISAKVGDAIVTTANYGESVTLDVIPDTGYTVKSVKVGNTEIEPVNGVYSFTMPDNDVTVTAEFEAITYSVAFNKNSNDATGSMDNQSFTGGTAQNLTANGFTAPTGYHFAGWATSANGAVEYADGAEVSNLTAVNNDTVTLYAKWEANKHTVTYKVDGEVYGAVDTVAYGTALTAREAPTKTGYTFSGWSEIPATMPDEDVVITGSFIINKYAVTWKNGDTTLETDTNVPYGTAPSYDGATPTKAATAQYSYTFSGWSDGTNTYAADALPTVSGNVTYTAQFNSTAKTYTITYKMDGEVYDTKTVSYGDSIALIDAPTREGYTFSGWQTSYTTMPASNIEITGTFAINTYAVTYMVDGVQYGESLTVDHGTKLTAPTAPAKNGAIFLGWTADGVNAYDFETPVTAETTLTAMWLDASGFITFSEGYAVTDDTYNGTDRDYVGFRFDVNMDNSNYTVVQHGILYGMNVAAFGNGQADANLRFTDEEATALMNKVREFAAQNTDTDTTDWIEVYIGDRRDGIVYARGFIIVTDGTNNYLIYSDVIEGSYNSFNN